jgi:hypothetical protein
MPFRPVYGLVFLFKYVNTGKRDVQYDDSNDVFFAKQVRGNLFLLIPHDSGDQQCLRNPRFKSASLNEYLHVSHSVDPDEHRNRRNRTFTLPIQGIYQRVAVGHQRPGDI